jgi:DNA uptake protein ComE-like DNA-binding protein
MMIRSRALFTAMAAVLISATAQAQVGRTPGMVDPNLATEKELTALPNVTPQLAKGIVEKRPFLRQADFDAFLAPTLSKEQRAQLYAKSFVHLNLNSASDEEIQMIPGVGAKMLHEFKEYRPYKALAQFRREIGKYVKGDELARLEGYVFVPINLNTASDADILTIPGVGAKMLHEFKEYRPYTDIERFRREIGKYVNAKEVARLERYVAVK